MTSYPSSQVKPLVKALSWYSDYKNWTSEFVIKNITRRAEEALKNFYAQEESKKV